jgi:hypothetical protein
VWQQHTTTIRAAKEKSRALFNEYPGGKLLRRKEEKEETGLSGFRNRSRSRELDVGFFIHSLSLHHVNPVYPLFYLPAIFSSQPYSAMLLQAYGD